MNFKRGFYIFCPTIMFFVLTSCLNGDETETYIPIDAQITSLTLSQDSVPDLAGVVFSIDQMNGLIYNEDSMAYGTTIKEKVIVHYATNAAAVLNVTNLANKDSTWVASGDSLDISSSVHLRTYAYSGVNKYYWLKLNIHQVDPDSIQYSQIADNQSFLNAEATKTIHLNQVFYTFSKTNSGIKLYRSTNGTTWSENTLSGLPSEVLVKDIQTTDIGLFAWTSTGQLYQSTNAEVWQSVTTPYPVKAYFGHLVESPLQASGSALILLKDGKNVFAYTSDFQTWLYGPEVPQDFPLTGFSALNNYSMSLDRITVIGGKNASGNVFNTVWSTSNGLYWAKISNTNAGLLPLMEGANAFKYNNRIYLLNGKMVEDGTYNKSTYYSKDGGVVWELDSTKTFVPEEYKGRYDASVVVDKDNYMYIVGGRENQPLTDIWKGILNKLSFKK